MGIYSRGYIEIWQLIKQGTKAGECFGLTPITVKEMIVEGF